MINRERLWERLMALGTVGRQESGGVTRLSFTAEERAAKEMAAAWMREAGLSVREDAAGNLIGRKEGLRADAPAVLIGSHLDTVYDGGLFDGALGVLAGIEVLQTMDEQGIATEHPIELIAFTDEEGARFSFGMLGSRAMAGTLLPEHLQYRDKDGISVAEAMRRAGLNPEEIGKAVRPKGSVKAYVELHIEQGKVLESRNLSVGVVTGIAGPLWLKFVLEGEAGHAGATPMDLRRDPLAAAAEIMRLIEREAARSGTTVGTVGQLQVSPGGINIIPGRVEFSLDLRDIDESVRDRVERKILEESERICEGRGVKCTVQLLQRIPSVPCSEQIREAAVRACRKLGFEPFSLPSGAGHDGMQLTGLCPIGMIFVRSKGGISHSPAEWSSKEDCGDGADVLFHTVLELAVQE